MLCNCNSKIDVVSPTIADQVVANEDLAFLIASYLCPITRNPSRLSVCHKLCIVSKRWHQSFSLVRAQLRFDHLIQHTNEDDENTLYHKISYIPGCTTEGNAGQTIPLGPREGCLQIQRSCSKKACVDACHEYRNFLERDEDSGREDRPDSRADYYYRAHHESPTTEEYILPRPLIYDSTISFTNEIEFDDKPRLVNKFTANIGDITGAENPLAADGEKSKEGKWNLGFFEIVRVQEMITSSCNTRPPKGSIGKDTTYWLRACGARPSDHPRWVRFCHLVGEDQCRIFLKKHLIPMLGPRPTGNSFSSSLTSP